MMKNISSVFLFMGLVANSSAMAMKTKDLVDIDTAINETVNKKLNQQINYHAHLNAALSSLCDAVEKEISILDQQGAILSNLIDQYNSDNRALSFLKPIIREIACKDTEGTEQVLYITRIVAPNFLNARNKSRQQIIFLNTVKNLSNNSDD